MKLLHKEQAEIWETKNAKGFEYPFENQNIDCAVVEIRGRFPEKGKCRNTEVDEMIFCKSGEGFIFFEKKLYHLKENSAILIKKNEWYFWTENTNGIFIPICNPAWSKKQVEFKEFE